MRLLFAAFLWLLAMPALAATASDIHYGPHKLQALDVYASSTCRSNCPVVIWVHGGGWSNGDKTVMGGEDGTKIGALWSQRGAVVVSINYRLTPDVQHPAHVEDVAAAINWVHKNIGQYGGDASRIYLLGHSAGAHLVALVATDQRYLQAYGLAPARNLAGVFPIDSAAYDLADDLDTPLVGNRIRDAFSASPAALAAASPLTYVRRGQSYPPFIFAGTLQHPDGIKSMNEMIAKLRTAGATAEGFEADYPGSRAFVAHRKIAEDLFSPASALTIKLMNTVGLRANSSAAQPEDNTSRRGRPLLRRQLMRE